MATVTKIQFGCGTNLLPGWQNHDMDVDMRQRLPYPDNHADFVFAEHCVEHLTCREALAFLHEVQRMLKPQGVLRIAVPSMEQFWRLGTQRHFDILHRRGWCSPNRQSAVQRLILEHEHQSWWSEDLLLAVLRSVGLQPDAVCRVGVSPRPELENIDAQWKQIDRSFNEAETVTVEAVKP